MSSNLVIVAIPAADDRIWKVSSEKIPHLTLLFLGESKNNPKIGEIYKFVSHAVSIAEQGPFYLDIDHRGLLGEDKADVIYFRKDWSSRWITQFRNQLLQNSDIRTAYDSTEQFSEWQPHLTLGYPDTPAHEDKIPEHGLNLVMFDRIAVWTGNYEGPEFRLTWPEREEDLVVAYSETGEVAVAELLDFDIKDTKSDKELTAAFRANRNKKRSTTKIQPVEEIREQPSLAQTTIYGQEFVDTLIHFGVKGMKWGVRKAQINAAGQNLSKELTERYGVRQNRSTPLPKTRPVDPQAVSKVPPGTQRKTKIETKGGENQPASEDALKVAQAKVKLQKSGPAALSNKELQAVANRVELEERVKRAVQPKGQKFVTNLLKTEGKQESSQFVKRQVRKKFVPV